MSVLPFNEVLRLARLARENLSTAIVENVPSANAEAVCAEMSIKEEPKEEPLTAEEIQAILNKYKNPHAQIKKNLQFDGAVVIDRLKAVGLDPFPIDLDERTLHSGFNRYYIHDLYGGNPSETFPRPAKEKFKFTGINDLMCLSLDWNPHAPLNPGDPGLYFIECAASGAWPEIQRVFVKTCTKPKALWKHMGYYRMTPSESLSCEEFSRQPNIIKQTWANGILDKGWGCPVWTRIWLRRQNHGEPSPEEVEEICSNKLRLAEIKKTLRWQEISEAYVRGDEELGVWCMKCVGYDVEFQHSLVDNVGSYKPPEPGKKRKHQAEQEDTEAISVAEGLRTRKSSKATGKGTKGDSRAANTRSKRRQPDSDQEDYSEADIEQDDSTVRRGSGPL